MTLRRSAPNRNLRRAGASFLAVVVLSLLGPSSARSFATNSFRFESTPVRWWYNPANEPPPPPGTTWEAIIETAAANWSGVGCADVSFAFEGLTDAEWGDDGQNVIFWPEEWLFQDAAAGATLHDPQDPDEPREVDLALNGLNFQWVAGGGDAFETHVLDPESVITHELGHWLGLAHSSDQFATMYAAKLIGTMQASLNSDDKFGICTLYPNGNNECETHADCPAGYACHEKPGGDLRACGELRTPIGGHCSKDDLGCVDMCFITFWGCSATCAFTEEDFSDGYCAQLCLNGDGEVRDCGPGYQCRTVPGYDGDDGSDLIKACYRTETPPAEPPPDGPEEVDGPTVDEGSPSEQGPEGSLALSGGCQGAGSTLPVGWAMSLGLCVVMRRRRRPPLPQERQRTTV